MATSGKSMTDALAAGELDPQTAASLIADLKNFESLRGKRPAASSSGGRFAKSSGGTAKKAKVESDEDEDEYDNPDEENKEEDEDRVGKHTLDSDEEDEVKYKKMDVRKVEGQEEGNVDFDGKIKMTAFNMKEDLEDGHFDDAGNFIFEKKEEITDAWLDGLDWSDAKRRAGALWKDKVRLSETLKFIFQEEEEDDEATQLANQALHDGIRIEIYKGLIEFLKPGENITRALARVGKAKGLTAAEERAARWAAKKAGKTYDPAATSKEAEQITNFVDQLISAGEMEAYQLTYEKLKFDIDQLEHKAVDDVDMFGDEPVASGSAGPSAGAPTSAAEDQVEWEYQKEANGEIFGPFSSEQMQELKDEGKLPSGALARRKGTSAFYSAARTDFELYL